MTPDARANADFSTAGFIPNGRAAEPGEIADLAVFLLSPAAAQIITGQEIVVDGGSSLTAGCRGR